MKRESDAKSILVAFRVSEDLDDYIKKRANELGVSYSWMVRRILLADMLKFEKQKGKTDGKVRKVR